MTIAFTFPGYKNLAHKIIKKGQFEIGDMIVRNFPDKESYVKINSNVTDKEVVIICGLDNPNIKIMALIFFLKTAKELGAKNITLIAPYLGYMRQDKRFKPGEAITSNIFAELLSDQIDHLITIDPHLHRHKSLEEIYGAKCTTLHAANLIGEWIKNNIKDPLLIGPDEESDQWVSDIAKSYSLPFTILKKVRYSDNNVKISIPDIINYKNHTPVLIDDIISTASTMITTIKILQQLEMQLPICIGIHAIFANNAYADMKKLGVKIITCNTIEHASNQIDVSDIICSSFTKNN
jgi:ribose-phosphate pyrophosphokinase